jgi:hypothetical protein
MSGTRRVILLAVVFTVLGIVLIVVPAQASETARCSPAYICGAAVETSRSTTSVLVGIVGWISLVGGAVGLGAGLLTRRRKQRSRRSHRSYPDEF